jgi:hypothetical protein
MSSNDTKKEFKDRDEEFRLRFEAICDAIRKWELETFGKSGFIDCLYVGYRSYKISDGGSPMSGFSTKSYSSSRLREYYFYAFELFANRNIYWSDEDQGYPEDINKQVEVCMERIKYRFEPYISKLILTNPK